MKLAYQQATISFCVDLASPNGESIPVANLLVGETEGRPVAGVAVLVPDHLDPIARAMLSDAHQLVRQYVDEAFEHRAPEAPLGEVLSRVYHSLRNSMHVSSISEPAQIVLEGAAELGGMVLHLLRTGLVKALADVGRVVAADALPATESARPAWAQPQLDLPPSFIWAPSRPMPGAAAAAG